MEGGRARGPKRDPPGTTGTAHSNDFVGRSTSPFSEFDKVSVRSARRLVGAMVSVGRNELRAHADSSVDD